MKLTEAGSGFQVADLKNVLEPKLHVDEYRSKIGRDDKNIVLSFLVNDKTAAGDLIEFLERGYDFILDATVSTSEIKLGKYLVFVELLRRTRAVQQIIKILSDLSASCGSKPEEWEFAYMKNRPYLPLTIKNLKHAIPLSPKSYRIKFNEPINELRIAAGIPTQTEIIAEDLKSLQFAAGINYYSKSKI